MVSIIAVTDDAGIVVEPRFLARAEEVHRQLRPQLPADYAARMRRIFEGGGRMAVAAEGDSVRGVGVFRRFENTCYGTQFYVDDLVTAPEHRSTGVGHALMTWLQAKARALGADIFTLDSGTHRELAHKFYFREGLRISSFNFYTKLP